MALPGFDPSGDMPPGLYRATMGEVQSRFGVGGQKRRNAFATLKAIYDSVKKTGQLQRFIIFGSFVTAKPEPNDVDVFLVMSAEFEITEHARYNRDVFSHSEADRLIGASAFWVTQRLPQAMIEDYIQGWQNTRQGHRRGIVELFE
jgi:hypothetical protein